MVQQHVARGLITLVALFSLAVLGGVLTSRAFAAQTDTSSALYTLGANFANNGTVDLDDIQAPFNVSAASLINSNLLESDALNAILQKSGTDIPSMPATGLIQVEGAVQQDGAAYTEYTTAAQNTTQNDVPVLPATPAVDDAIYFGCDNPCRIVTWDVDTAGAGTWTLTYEYWDGSNFTALSNVDDRTSGFTVLGKKSVSWDMPIDWATRSTTGSAVNSYWGRARVSAFTSVTTQPQASRIRYENGEWWAWVEDLDLNNQEQYTLYLGGPSDLRSYHELFPGTAGIITGDDASIELGNDYSFALEGRLDFSAAAATTCIFCKTGAVTVNVSGSASSPAIGNSFTGASTSNGDVGGLAIGNTGSQRVIVGADGTNAATWVTASTGGMRSYDVQTITDNANNVTWASNGGVNYFDWIRLDNASPTVFDVRNQYTEFVTATHTNTQAFSSGLGLGNQ